MINTKCVARERRSIRTYDPALPLLVPNVVIVTVNVVIHALRNLPEAKKEEEKKRRNRGEVCFLSLDKLHAV